MNSNSAKRLTQNYFKLGIALLGLLLADVLRLNLRSITNPHLDTQLRE
jgi:hypothetical protein